MSDVTAKLSTALADRYQIERLLGEGGMATVYLAEDLKHKRKVAVKVLRPELAAVLGAERFVQEITTTASLQHPHILPLFDSGTAGRRDGETEFLYYVMPYVDGETLREKLDRETQLSIDEAVRITTDVADALDYAHRNSVIHRDIKPENILLHDGRPMVADFGIALAVSAAAGGRMTETGLSLGTPHYMSPEQATAEKDLTNRSDIYSLGSVLYEMLTGEPPHMGNSAQQIIMKIVTEDAQPVTKLRKSVPPNVAAAVAQSLEKLAADRFASAKEFAEALGDPAFAATIGAAGTSPSALPPFRRSALPPALAATVVLALALAAWGWLRPRVEPTSQVLRYAMAFPKGEEIAGWFTRLALSPDGSRLVYLGVHDDGGRQLWMRSRDQLHGTPMAGTEGAEAPFFSPDGNQVGFFSPRGAIRIASVGGGEAVRLTDSLVGVAGASWGTDGFIYADAQGQSSLVRVAAAGGTPEWFTTLDSANGEVDHVWPEALPEGRGVLFVVKFRDNPFSSQIAVADVSTGRHTMLVPGIYARYAASGHLLYVTREGTLMAQGFDLGTRTLTGEAAVLVEGMLLATIGAPDWVPDIVVSTSGTLMYMNRTGLRDSTEAVWVTRAGAVRVVDPDWTDQLEQGLALSPDGSRLAFSHSGQVWIRQLDGGPTSKLTFEGGNRPFWTPDGTAIGFTTDRDGHNNVYWRRADGTGSADLLLDHEPQILEGQLSDDGRWAVYRVGGGGNSDLYGVHLGVDSVPVPLVVSYEQETQPALSPGGRWLAYVSLATGRPEVWVRPFPNTVDGRWQVSEAGGTEPVWAHSGRELFYRSGSDELVSVEITQGSTFIYGEPRVLFSVRDYVGFIYRQMYDVTPDDRRFIMVRRIIDTDRQELVAVENFFAELKAKVEN